MIEEKGTPIGRLMSPLKGIKMSGDVMKGLELPSLRGIIFDSNTPNTQELRDDRFPPDLIFSPIKGMTDLQGYKDLVPPAPVSSPIKNAAIEQQMFSQDVISLQKELFPETKKSKPKAKRTRKRRRGGNSSSRATRKGKKTHIAPSPPDPTPRMCTAPLCGTIHTSIDDLRNHIISCHPNMRMRCWFPGCKQTFLIPEDLEEHAMDEHMPKRESSFFSRTKIRFNDLTEVPADGRIRPTKERKQRSPRVPTAVEARSRALNENKESLKPSRQIIARPVQSPSALSKIMPPTISTPVPSPSFRLKERLPFKWITDNTVENSAPSSLDRGTQDFFCLDPNPRMPGWNNRVTEMHTHWVNDRKRAGYTPEIEVTDTNVAKEDRESLQPKISSFVTAHLSNLSAVLHVDDQKYSGSEVLSFTMDTPKRTVIARVTGMEYSSEEWNKKQSSAESRSTEGIYHLNNGKAIIDGYSC